MRIGATSPEPSPPRSLEAPPNPRAPAFSSVLAAQLQAPRDRIELTRSEIRASIEAARSAALAAPSDRAYDAAGRRLDVVQERAATGGSDPFGWRALSRDLGERIVGPGFGDLFERQIQQESAFEPDVVFGYRKSSAGAEGIAQLMPQYYPNVDRTDPRASLIAGAQSMRHYLEVNGGDVRKALASYNAGLGTVQSLVRAHGAQWERGLPEETRSYLAAILGPARPRVEPASAGARWLGGTDAGGVLTPPIEATGRSLVGDTLHLEGRPGASVRAPSDATVASAAVEDGLWRIALDHGGGWVSTLAGLDASEVKPGDRVTRGQPLGTLPEGPEALLRFSLVDRERPVNPSDHSSASVEE